MTANKRTMKNLIPDTPRSCIEAMATTANNPSRWNKQWDRFYNIYFNLIEACVRRRFIEYRFWASETLQNDTIALVYTNLISAVRLYDPQRASFHQYLFWIIRISVIQAIKAHKHDPKAVVFNDAKDQIKYFLKEAPDGTRLEEVIEKITFIDELADEKPRVEAICEDELKMAREALYAELVEETKSKVSPRMAMVFQLRVMDGLSSEEVAKKLGITSNLVDNDKYRFIKKLNEIAAKEPYANEIKKLK